MFLTFPRSIDVPRAGDLISKVFNDLTMRIITELQETVASQINDAVNRRHHAVAEIDLDAKADDPAKCLWITNSRRLFHQSKVTTLGGRCSQDADGRSPQEMISLSKRLRDFADTVNHAHEKFFKE